jgi:hypothetical protein
MKYFLYAITLCLWLATTSDALEIVYAVNSGGEAHRSSTGICYATDTNTEGIPYIWPMDFNGVSGSDKTLYKTAQHDAKKFSYTLPVTGDGWYGLLLHFTEDSTYANRRKFDVLLNGQHTLLSNYNIFNTCGLYNVCNEIFYFSICLGQLQYGNQNSVVQDDKVRLEFISKSVNAVVDGILLVKGKAGEGKFIVGTKTVFYFHPEREYKCTDLVMKQKC